MYKSYLIIFIVVICSCNSNYDKTLEIVNRFHNKPIIFPNEMIFTKYIYDTIEYDYNSKLKLLYYVDSIGCLSCKLQLEGLNNFLLEINNLTKNNFSFIITITPNNDKFQLSRILLKLRELHFNQPIFIDLNDSLNKLNHFPSDERFHCFLLDKNNQVILIGNPVQNPKIKELYIRTICERLGIDTTNIKITETQKENSFSFGRFSYLDTMKTQFVLRNDSLSELKIDTIFTSCECTTAKIDKSVIKKSDSAIISIAFKTDKPEEFMREVYVKTNSYEKPIVYTIEGLTY